MEYQRTVGPDYPLVYDSFKLKLKGSDKEEEYVIQDLTENYFKEAADILAVNHELGAVFHMAAGTMHDDPGRAYVKLQLMNTFREKVSLICVNKTTQEIVGLNCLYVRSKTSMEPQITDNEKYSQFKAACNYMNGKSDILNRFDVDKALFAAGLCVVKKFRNNGFARRILAARGPLLSALDLKVTSSIFSTVNAQKAATNAGYEELCTISYEELAAVFPRMDFQFAFPRSARVMALKV